MPILNLAVSVFTAEQISEYQTLVRNLKREWSNPEATKEQIAEAEAKKNGKWATMKPVDMIPAINALFEAAWTSGGITLEQKNTDSPNPGYIMKYFNDKDDAEIGGHWNTVSGGDELKACTMKLFGTDGAMSFSQFKASTTFYGQYAMPILAEESKK